MLPKAAGKAPGEVPSRSDTQELRDLALATHLSLHPDRPRINDSGSFTVAAAPTGMQVGDVGSAQPDPDRMGRGRGSPRESRGRGSPRALSHSAGSGRSHSKGPKVHDPPRRRDVESVRDAGYECAECRGTWRTKSNNECTNPRCESRTWVRSPTAPLRGRQDSPSVSGSERPMSAQRDPHTDRMTDDQRDARANRASPLTPPDALSAQDTEREGREAIEELRRIEAGVASDRQRDERRQFRGASTDRQGSLSSRERDNSMPPVGHAERDHYLRNQEAQGLHGVRPGGARLRSVSGPRRAVRMDRRSASPIPSDGPGRLLPTTTLAEGASAGASGRAAQKRSPSPNKISFGTVTLGEGPAQRTRSRSRGADLITIHETDAESETDDGSVHGLRTAAQLANRGRCETSEGSISASESEAESLPSENDAVKMVEAMQVTAWRTTWGLEIDAEFAHAFGGYGAALIYGEAVAKAWQRTSDWISLHGSTLVQDLIPAGDRAKEQKKAAQDLKRKAKIACANKKYGARAQSLLAKGGASDRKPSEADAKEHSNLTPVFSLFMTRCGIGEWNDAACGPDFAKIRTEFTMRRVEDTVKNNSIPTLIRGRQTIGEFTEWWIEAYPDTEMKSLCEMHVEQWLHSESCAGKTQRAEVAFRWVNKHLLQNLLDFKKIRCPERKTPASNAVGATARSALEIHPAMFTALEKALEKDLAEKAPLCLAVLSCWMCAAACLRQKHCLASHMIVAYKDFSLWFCPSGKTRATKYGFYWYMWNYTSSGFDWCEAYLALLQERNERYPQFVDSP